MMTRTPYFVNTNIRESHTAPRRGCDIQIASYYKAAWQTIRHCAEWQLLI